LLDASRKGADLDAKLETAARNPAPLSPPDVQALPRSCPANSKLKRFLDLLVAIPALILVSPLMLIIAICIKLIDGGKAIFTQSRYGQNGTTFRFYKFRTMRPGADGALENMLSENQETADQWRRQRKLPRDPRITALGQFLRETSLDELPQLINIIRGEMSVVGPRPMVMDTNDDLDDRGLYGPDFRYYIMTRPGMTGLWQVSGRADTTFADRVALDVHYVKTWSLWQDFLILLRTVPAVLFGRGAS